jgi:hypothetical protein
MLCSCAFIPVEGTTFDGVQLSTAAWLSDGRVVLAAGHANHYGPLKLKRTRSIGPFREWLAILLGRLRPLGWEVVHTQD